MTQFTDHQLQVLRAAIQNKDADAFLASTRHYENGGDEIDIETLPEITKIYQQTEIGFMDFTIALQSLMAMGTVDLVEDDWPHDSYLYFTPIGIYEMTQCELIMGLYS